MDFKELKAMVNKIEDIDILRQFIFSLSDENNKIKEHLDEVWKERIRQAQLKLGIADQLKVLRQIAFGKGSEKRKKEKEASDRPRSLQREALLLHAQSMAPAPQEEETKEIPVEIRQYELTDEEKAEEAKIREIENPEWEEIEGLYDESTEITVVERSYKKIKHRRKKYRLKSTRCDEPDEEEVLITAEGPEKLIPGAGYSIEFATTVVSDKYVYHTPLTRQVREMEALGLRGVEAKTLWNLCSAVAVHLEPLSEIIRKEIILAARAVHVDESPWPILDARDSDGYMWVVSNQAGSFYQFEPTRSGKVLKDLLKGLKGSVLCDGYSGYKRLEKQSHLKLAFCWAHVRRKFFEMEANYPDDCKAILDRIDQLFMIERKARDWEDLLALRQNESKAILDELYPKLLEIKIKALPESGLAKAATYTLKLWHGLKLFLSDSKIPLSNNDAERALRHAVMGRKNFYGSKTINGADVAATLYTIIESCKKVELDPKSFIEMTVKNIVRGEEALTPLQYAKKIRPAESIAA